MKSNADTSQQNSSKAAANGIAQKKKESEFQFEDKRPETLVQRNLQNIVNSSSQVAQRQAFQEIANTAAPEPLKRKESPEETQQDNFQRKENNTGLPDTLKTGMENLSGYSLDDVKVHYDSAKPAQLQAHAYAQGTDIHIASGQEKHLPHEAWHVVQQKQGRVQPIQMKGGHTINDDRSLETEASTMGHKAIQFSGHSRSYLRSATAASHQPVQRMIEGLDDYLDPNNIPDKWVEAYIEDLLHDHTHLSQADIAPLYTILFADNPPMPQKNLQNTGGDHWNVEIVNAAGNYTIETRHDGNCGIHVVSALHQVATGAINQAPDAAYVANRGFIANARAMLKTIYETYEPLQIKNIIATAIKDKESLPHSGFGETLKRLITATGKIDNSAQVAEYRRIEIENAVSAAAAAAGGGREMTRPSAAKIKKAGKGAAGAPYYIGTEKEKNKVKEKESAAAAYPVAGNAARKPPYAKEKDPAGLAASASGSGRMGLSNKNGAKEKRAAAAAEALAEGPAGKPGYDEESDAMVVSAEAAAESRAGSNSGSGAGGGGGKKTTARYRDEEEDDEEEREERRKERRESAAYAKKIKKKTAVAADEEDTWEIINAQKGAAAASAARDAGKKEDRRDKKESRHSAAAKKMERPAAAAENDMEDDNSTAAGVAASYGLRRKDQETAASGSGNSGLSKKNGAKEKRAAAAAADAVAEGPAGKPGYDEDSHAAADPAADYMEGAGQEEDTYKRKRRDSAGETAAAAGSAVEDEEDDDESEEQSEEEDSGYDTDEILKEKGLSDGDEEDPVKLVRISAKRKGKGKPKGTGKKKTKSKAKPKSKAPDEISAKVYNPQRAVKRTARSIRKLRTGTATEADNTPILVRMGSQMLEMAPSPWRKDVGVFQTADADGGGRRRVGSARSYEELGKELDKIAKKKNQSAAKIRQNLKDLMAGDPPTYPLDDESRRLVAETAGVLMSDKARGSAGSALVNEFLDGKEDFGKAFKNKKGSYRPAWKAGKSKKGEAAEGGSKFIQEESQKRKAAAAAGGDDYEDPDKKVTHKRNRKETAAAAAAGAAEDSDEEEEDGAERRAKRRKAEKKAPAAARTEESEDDEDSDAAAKKTKRKPAKGKRR
ncbi:MAG: hypothetical protein K0S33_2441 [Bacteroidetes bacterium]|nr:hypothetical protein [Bacteroidota bacterium]